MKWKRQHKTQCRQISADVEQWSSQELLQEIEQILATNSSADMDTDKLATYLRRSRQSVLKKQIRGSGLGQSAL